MTPITALESREVYVDVPGGQVWCRIVGGGDAAPLITVHGGPGSPHDYLTPLEHLSKDRPVVFFDQLGCGRSEISPPPDTDSWQVERSVEELDAVIAALGFEEVHLHGHSYGAIPAVEVALAGRAPIASLSLSSPCLNMHRVRDDIQRLLADLPESLREIITQHEAAGTVDSMEYQVASSEFSRHHICRMHTWPEPFLRSLNAWNMAIYRTMWGSVEFTPNGTLRDYSIENRLTELDMPVLYTCGRYDEVTPESTEAYQRQTPNGHLVIFEKSAHVPHLEEPELFRATLANFLAGDMIRSF